MEFCHPQYPFILETTFFRRYEASWAATKPQGVAWTGLVNMVFALGCHFSPETPLSIARDFFLSSKALIFPAVLDSPTFEMLQTLVLMSLYLQSTRDSKQCWSVIGLSVRLAQNLGLHLRKTYDAIDNAEEREQRVRAWWACYVLDIISGMMHGRPPSMNEDAFNVPLPADFNDGCPRQDQSGPERVIESESGPSGTSPSLMSFFLVTVRSCQILGKVLTLYGKNDHLEALKIDRQLCDLSSKLPPHLQAEECPSDKRVWRQNRVLTSRYDFVTTRPQMGDEAWTELV